MRVLGTTFIDHDKLGTDDGYQRYIVELKRAEYAQLVKLSFAIKGEEHHWRDDYEPITEIDLSLALHAIHNFSNIKGMVEQLKIMLQELDNKLMTKNDQ